MCESVHWALFDLVLDSFEEEEEGRTHVVLQVVVHTESHPIGEHLLYDGFCPSEHQLRMLRAHGFIDEAVEETLEDVRRILHFPHEDDHEERGDVDSEKRQHKTR